MSVLNGENIAVFCANASVQEIWNVYENVIINICDLLAPLIDQPTWVGPKRNSMPPFIKSKINKRKNLLKNKN